MNRAPRRSCFSAAGALAAAGMLCLSLSAAAVPPTLDSLFPAGGRRGSTVAITASGKLETWPVKVWTDSPGLKIEAGDKSPKLTAHIAPDTPAGPHLVRIYTTDGASALHCFMVGDQEELAEAEPNDEPVKAQPIEKFPVTLNGRLEKSGDVDCYAIKLIAGQTLVATLQGRRIGSPIDPMLHLLDEHGTQVAFAQDGLGLDPLLVYRALKAGKFTLNVSAFAFPPAADVRFTGNKDAVYRLNLTTGPYVRAASPSGVTRGRKSTLRPLGWNLDSKPIIADATNLPPGTDDLLIPVPGGDGPLQINVTDGEEIEEPTDPAQPPVTLPVSVTGVISAPGEEDHLQFTAKKGQRLELLVHANSINSPLDAFLRIRDDAGKLMDENHGNAGADPRLNWSAPKDGVYRATVYDLFHKGGPDYRYRLEIHPPRPLLLATILDDPYALVPGKTVTIKVNVARKNDHKTPMVAVATALPPGVTATSAEVPGGGGGEVSLILSATKDAKPASQPIRILLLSTDPAHPELLPATIDLHKDADKPAGQSYIERSSEVWLTLSPTADSTPPKKD